MGTFPFPLFPAFPSFTWTIPIPRHFAPQSKPGNSFGFLFTLELPNADNRAFLCVRSRYPEHLLPMKHRIPPRFHGPLCLIGFIAIMAVTAIIELIGGSR